MSDSAATGTLGRGDRIRTCDPLLPKQMRYQAALRPERGGVCTRSLGGVKPDEAQLGGQKRSSQVPSRSHLAQYMAQGRNSSLPITHGGT